MSSTGWVPKGQGITQPDTMGTTEYSSVSTCRSEISQSHLPKDLTLYAGDGVVQSYKQQDSSRVRSVSVVTENFRIGSSEWLVHFPPFKVDSKETKKMWTNQTAASPVGGPPAGGSSNKRSAAVHHRPAAPALPVSTEAACLLPPGNRDARSSNPPLLCSFSSVAHHHNHHRRRFFRLHRHPSFPRVDREDWCRLRLSCPSFPLAEEGRLRRARATSNSQRVAKAQHHPTPSRLGQHSTRPRPRQSSGSEMKLARQ